MGSTCGIAISTMVYQKTLSSALWNRFFDQPDAAGEISRLMDNIEELQHLPRGWHDGVMMSFSKAFHAVWLLILSATILGVISAIPVRQHVLHRTLNRTKLAEQPGYNTISRQ